MTSWMTYKGFELPDSPTTDPGDKLVDDLKYLADNSQPANPALDAFSTESGVVVSQRARKATGFNCEECISESDYGEGTCCLEYPPNLCP